VYLKMHILDHHLIFLFQNLCIVDVNCFLWNNWGEGVVSERLSIDHYAL